MYTAFYKLKRKPFQISSDPAFMWLGEKHKEALATLKYGILDNKGFLLLTGDVGTGKTTLINALIQSLSQDIISATVPDPGLEKMDFFNYIAEAFGMGLPFSTKGTFLAAFKRFLIQAGESGKKVLLIIDEAQLLTQEMLEEIRLLSNIEKAETKLINIFFVGQNEFNEILNRDQNRAVRQRLTLNYNIDPLTPEETGEYIAHRLAVAGADRPIFDAAAIQEVFLYSGGFPRRINVICDHCLLSGYVREQRIVSAAVVRECARELKIPSSVRNRDINGWTAYQPMDSPGTVPAKSPVRERPSGARRNKSLIWFFMGALICIFIGFSAVFFWSPDRFDEYAAFFRQEVRDLGSQWSGRISNPSDTATVPAELDTEGKVTQPIIEDPIQDETPRNMNADGSQTPAEIAKPSEEPARPDVEETFPYPSVQALSKQVPTPTADNHPAPAVLQGMDSGEARPILPEDGSASSPAVPELPKEKIVLLFHHNSNTISDEGLARLIAFSDILAAYPETRIRLNGFTDSDGYEAYNKTLSGFRANLVKTFLQGRGISGDRIEVVGRGSANPVESNQTVKGRMMNRRVEIEVLD